MSTDHPHLLLAHLSVAGTMTAPLIISLQSGAFGVTRTRVIRKTLRNSPSRPRSCRKLLPWKAFHRLLVSPCPFLPPHAILPDRHQFQSVRVALLPLSMVSCSQAMCPCGRTYQALCLRHIPLDLPGTIMLQRAVQLTACTSASLRFSSISMMRAEAWCKGALVRLLLVLDVSDSRETSPAGRLRKRSGRA